MSNKMTIAQGIRRVNKLKGLIAEAQGRATEGVSYQSDKVPAFRFADSVKTILDSSEELIDLQTRIAAANASATVSYGKKTLSLAKAVRLLEEIRGLIAFYKRLNLKSGVEKTRSQDWDDDACKTITRTEEITYISDLSEVERDTTIKELNDRFEKLNNAVEDINHVTMI